MATTKIPNTFEVSATAPTTKGPVQLTGIDTDSVAASTYPAYTVVYSTAISGLKVSDGAVWTTVGAGSVTSVGLDLPDIFDVTVSPITSSGDLTATLADQAANKVFAGPTTGADDTPAFRALVAADLPATTVSANSYGSASVVATFTVDAAGRLTAAGSATIAIGDSAVTYSTRAANLVFAGPTTGSAQAPTFRSLVAADLPNTAVSANSYGSASAVATFTVDAMGRLTAAATTSIAIADSAVTFASHTANMIFAGPATGVAAAPTWRLLVAADIPSLSAAYLPLAGGTMTGALLFTNNAVDIGAVGGTMPRTGYFGTSIVTPTIGPSASQQHTLPAATSDTIVLLAASQVLTNKTLTSPTINSPTLGSSVIGTYTLAGTPSLGANVTMTSATYAIGDTTHLLTALATAKVIGGSSNTSGHTVPNVADDTFVLLAATQEVTNKTMTAQVIKTGLTASGSASNDFSSSTGAFKTSTGAVSIGTGAVTFSGSSHLITVSGLTFTDNTLDIGASGATRPRTGYFGTSIVNPLYTMTTGATETTATTIAITGGIGGASAGVAAGGIGSAINVTGGVGGAGAAAKAAGIGGAIAIKGGDAGANGGGGGAAGGAITIDGGLASGAASNGIVTIGAGNTAQLLLGKSSIGTTATANTFAIVGKCTIAPPGITNSGTILVKITGPTGTTNTTAGGENQDFWLNCSRTVTWAAGTLALQRQFQFDPQTIAFQSSSTMTDGHCVYIGGALVKGTSATFTNTYGLTIASNQVSTSGTIAIAASLHVVGAPTTSGGTLTAAYAVLVDAGTTKLGGDLQHSGTNLGFYGAAVVAKQAGVEAVTNNVTSGGTTGTIGDITTGGNVGTDVRDALYQIARKLKQHDDALFNYGLISH